MVKKKLCSPWFVLETPFFPPTCSVSLNLHLLGLHAYGLMEWLMDFYSLTTGLQEDFNSTVFTVKQRMFGLFHWCLGKCGRGFLNMWGTTFCIHTYLWGPTVTYRDLCLVLMWENAIVGLGVKTKVCIEFCLDLSGLGCRNEWKSLQSPHTDSGTRSCVHVNIKLCFQLEEYIF